MTTDMHLISVVYFFYNFALIFDNLGFYIDFVSKNFYFKFSNFPFIMLCNNSIASKQ